MIPENMQTLTGVGVKDAFSRWLLFFGSYD
jgi:hypothetical protein